MPSPVDRILRNALAELKAERAKIDHRIGAIESALSGDEVSRPSAQQPKGRRGRKRMSDAARKAIARKLKAYWAKRRASVGKGGAKATGKKTAK